MAPLVNSTTITSTSGIPVPYYFRGVIDPKTPSTAIVPVVQGEAVYPANASTIGAGGHVIGVLGYITNSNTGILPLAIGIEGKIDNPTTGTITSAICNKANLGSNNGVINNCT